MKLRNPLKLKQIVSKWLVFHITWVRLRSIGQHKFVSSMYIWLFVVPLLANALSNIEQSFPITVFNYTFELKSSLPFSWQAFFYSSLLFTLANILRLIFCPRIINDHPDYASFKNSHKDSSHLVEYETEFEASITIAVRRINLERKNSYGKSITEEQKATIFWEIHKNANQVNKWVQYLTSLFYLFGFLLITLVVIQNIQSVLKFI